MKMPEEQNRILTDRISSVLFCPTAQAIKNLSLEGYDHLDNDVVNVGDVMFDAATFYSKISAEKSTLNLKEKDYLLVTCHRAENTDDIDRLSAIVNALNTISKDHHIVFPLHPRTKKMLELHNISLNFQTIPPVGYFDMIELLKGASIVMSDSGGLQKEAYFFNKPCITMRDETEWVELIEAGVNKLAGADTQRILDAFHFFKNEITSFPKGMYGDSHAAQKIVDYLTSH